MNFFAQRRLLQVWIVMLTFLFGLVAPSITRALEYQQGRSSSIEICTTSGTKLIKLDGDGQRESTPAKASIEHCLYCATHSPLLALPATGTLVLPAVSGRTLYPARYYSSAYTAHVWSAANPRAPPVRA
ncbi:DUF2946 domain-containing protein [Pseudoduganella danionis]|uniref:DUF2946 domain-containing protein n=1 Tax=Pseudoduganella danionis TaxID=1890295 RepID=A0ABW9SHP1_9BURK|nr:DUF2946 domain-containing protein [Pseudoduganella danionis]MTW31593.1 DUF2946 domain-containing protein [Pseudoduganella danionis]